MSEHCAPNPSPWITRFAHLVSESGRVLDLACGGGRHGRYFLTRGARVIFLDRDVSGVADLKDSAEIIEADLEGGAPWPLPGRRFDGVVVVNYLFRPLWPSLLAAVAPGGVLLYETFALGNERFGRPKNPDFLLRPGELLAAVGGELQVAAYEASLEPGPSGPRVVQRICAVRSDEPVSLSEA